MLPGTYCQGRWLLSSFVPHMIKIFSPGRGSEVPGKALPANCTTRTRGGGGQNVAGEQEGGGGQTPECLLPASPAVVLEHTISCKQFQA